MNRRSGLLLFTILGFYAALHIATSYQPRCDGDCEKIENINAKLSANHPYVRYVQRCTYRSVSDTICVYVRDTIGINWNLLADSTCYFANREGLPRQKVFVIRQTNFPADTLVRMQCP
jgi:hypothetical protein